VNQPNDDDRARREIVLHDTGGWISGPSLGAPPPDEEAAGPCEHCEGTGYCADPNCRDTTCSDFGRTMVAGGPNPSAGQCGMCRGTGSAR